VTAFLGLLEYPTIGNLMLQQQKTSPKPENGHQKNEKNTQKNKNTTQHNTTTEAGQEAVCIATGRAFIIIIIIRC
jgi:hypothetical protein